MFGSLESEPNPSSDPMDASQFLTALLAIIVIDLVLAGDNAIVIALAARSLPPHLQKRAILWGAIGAIGVRSLMTVAVVALLKIPGLLAIGGLLLIWIAWKLLQPEEGEGHEQGAAATTFWGAMRTIVIADAIMGLDNVLAVAGAAHGSYLLVVVGLAISVPIVIWGSTIVLRIVERYPSVIYLGAGVLVWTAIKMVTSEPLVKPVLAQLPWLAAVMYLAVPLLLWLAFSKNHRRLDTRIRARLSEFESKRPGQPGAEGAAVREGEAPLLNVLVPIDGTENSLLAVRHAIEEYRANHGLALVLLNVQQPLMRHAARFVSRTDSDEFHEQRAKEAMASAVALLAEADVPYTVHWRVGDRAQEICAAASRFQCHHIVMGTARQDSLTRMLQDSTTNQVLESTPVPVEVIAGKAVAKFERWIVPAVVVAVGGLLWLAMA